LLTVDEAAQFLRIGRTKAYAMAREWRATGGRSGLPVVDFGHVLRVPRRALEALIADALAPATEANTTESSHSDKQGQAPDEIVATERRSRPRHRPNGQTQSALFDTSPPAA
jgi:hypothetical protein